MAEQVFESIAAKVKSIKPPTTVIERHRSNMATALGRDLPNELLDEILHLDRLSVSELAGMRLVCKHWRDLIDTFDWRFYVDRTFLDTSVPDNLDSFVMPQPTISLTVESSGKVTMLHKLHAQQQVLGKPHRACQAEETHDTDSARPVLHGLEACRRFCGLVDWTLVTVIGLNGRAFAYYVDALGATAEDVSHGNPERQQTGSVLRNAFHQADGVERLSLSNADPHYFSDYFATILQADTESQDDTGDQLHNELVESHAGSRFNNIIQLIPILHVDTTCGPEEVALVLTQILKIVKANAEVLSIMIEYGMQFPRLDHDFATFPAEIHMDRLEDLSVSTTETDPIQTRVVAPHLRRVFLSETALHVLQRSTKSLLGSRIERLGIEASHDLETIALLFHVIPTWSSLSEMVVFLTTCPERQTTDGRYPGLDRFLDCLNKNAQIPLREISITEFQDWDGTALVRLVQGRLRLKYSHSTTKGQAIEKMHLRGTFSDKGVYKILQDAVPDIWWESEDVAGSIDEEATPDPRANKALYIEKRGMVEI